MIHIIALLAILGCGYAAPNNGCLVGDWEDWGACRATKSCSGAQGTSWSAPPEHWDTGRIKMAYIMQQKNKLYEMKKKCLAEGTCPELAPRKSEGRQDCVNGASGDNPCRNVHQLSFLDFDDLGYTVRVPADNRPEANDIWGWVDPETGDEYAIMGINGGTSFVRVTDPESPVPVGFLASHNEIRSKWRDIKVIGNWAYIVSEASGHGIQIFDLTRLRGLTSIRDFAPNKHYDRVGNCHNLVANEETGFIYAVGCTRGSGYDLCRGGLHVVDVNDPMNPQFAGCFGDDGYVHDAQCVTYNGPDSRYMGSEICICFNENSFTIVDVDNKDNMRVISRKVYSGSQYTHQGWFSEDQSIVLLDDELDEMRSTNKRTKTYIWDVMNLENPELRHTYYSTETSIDHNQYTHGGLTYQANYEAGLRILHIDQANYDLNEVGYFDVFPSRTTATFAGTWSVYPYFPSRNIILSSIDYGLYILRPDYEAMDAAIKDGKVHAEQSRLRSVLYKSDGATCSAVLESRTCDTPC